MWLSSLWSELKSHFLPNFHMKRTKLKEPSEREKDREISIEAWINIPWSPDRGRRILTFLQTLNRGLRTAHFWILCSPLTAKKCHVYTLCSKQKIVIGTGCTSSGRYSCPVTFCTSTFFQIFVRPSEPCLGLYRIFSTFVKGFKLASPWRGRQGDPVGIGTFWDRAWNLKLSAPTLVPYGSPRCSAVVFPQ